MVVTILGLRHAHRTEAEFEGLGFFGRAFKALEFEVVEFYVEGCMDSGWKGPSLKRKPEAPRFSATPGHSA